MSNKVPVFRSVGAAYSFLFNNFLEIIRMVWVPIAITWIGIAVLFFFVFAGLASSGGSQLPFDQAIEQFEEFGEIIGLLALASFLMVFVVSMAPYRIYFDLPRGESIFYLRFGLPELRYFVFTILFQILIGLVTALFGSLNAALIGMFADPVGEVAAVSAYALVIPVQSSEPQISSETLAFAFLIFLQVAAVIYLAIRLSLAPAIIAAERKVGLIRSWRLTRGNFWRLFFGAILMLFSILFVLLVVFLLLSLVIGLPLSLVGSLSTEMVSNLEMQQLPIGIGGLISGLFLFVLQLCFFTVPLGMSAGFLGRAYEGIVEGD